MTDEVIPHFHNDLGVQVIQIGAKKFMCMGALPPQDHPHVFCDIPSPEARRPNDKQVNDWLAKFGISRTTLTPPSGSSLSRERISSRASR
jgi:uncharacterized Zn-finger protein